MPFKDTKEGQTHSYNDGCGEPEHNNMNQDYERNHSHCWDQKKAACGQPIENHKQCCLCDTPYPKTDESMEKRFDDKFAGGTFGFQGNFSIRDEIQSFINSELSLSRSKRDNDILEKIEKVFPNREHFDGDNQIYYDMGHESTKRNIISIIKGIK